MKYLNFIILIIFSLAGILVAQENIASGQFSEWSNIFYVFPAAVITGLLGLAMSIPKYPISTWDKFSWDNFGFNQTQPPTFFTYFGLIFTCIGLVGFISAYLQNLGYYNYPAIIFAIGCGIFIAGLIANLLIYVSRRKT